MLLKLQNHSNTCAYRLGVSMFGNVRAFWWMLQCKCGTICYPNETCFRFVLSDAQLWGISFFLYRNSDFRVEFYKKHCFYLVYIWIPNELHFFVFPSESRLLLYNFNNFTKYLLFSNIVHGNRNIPNGFTHNNYALDYVILMFCFWWDWLLGVNSQNTIELNSCIWSDFN